MDEFKPGEFGSMEALRLKRNRLLAEYDWTQLPDVALSIEEVGIWKKYRQELRDLPSKAEADKNGMVYVTLPKALTKR